MQNLKVALLVAFFLTCQASDAQIVADSLSAKGKIFVEKQIDERLETDFRLLKWATGLTVGAISLYTIYMALGGLKRKIEFIFEKKAEDIVIEKLEKATDLKIDDLRVFFLEVAKQKSIKSSARITVINKRGKYLTLSNEIERSGFTTDDYRPSDKLSGNMNINTCDLVIIDNSDGAYQEKDVTDFFDLMKDKVKLVYLASMDLSNENFQIYRSVVKIIKLMDRLGDTIKLALN